MYMRYFAAVLLTLFTSSIFAQTFNDGWSALLQRRFDVSEDVFRRLDQKNDPNGAFGLGVMHQFGYGSVKRDYNVALSYYLKAAKSNIPGAIHNIGYLYQHGLGVQVDLIKAASWYERSADLGFSTSQHDLAFMYETGLGVKTDLFKAFALYKKSAAAGEPKSMLSLGAMYANGSGVKRDDLMAYAYLKCAQTLGEPVDVNWINGVEKTISSAERSSAEKVIRTLLGQGPIGNSKSTGGTASTLPWR